MHTMESFGGEPPSVPFTHIFPICKKVYSARSFFMPQESGRKGVATDVLGQGKRKNPQNGKIAGPCVMIATFRLWI